MPQIWNNVQESLLLLFCQFHCLFWLSIQLSVPFVYSTVYSICQIIKTTLCKIDIFSDIAKTIRIQKLWSIKLSIQICSKFIIWMETLTLKIWYAINELYSQTLLNLIYNHIAQIKFMKRIERYIIKCKLISTLYRVYRGHQQAIDASTQGNTAPTGRKYKTKDFATDPDTAMLCKSGIWVDSFVGRFHAGIVCRSFDKSSEAQVLTINRVLWHVFCRFLSRYHENLSNLWSWNK